jgi:hypothetical protein
MSFYFLHWFSKILIAILFYLKNIKVETFKKFHYIQITQHYRNYTTKYNLKVKVEQIKLLSFMNLLAPTSLQINMLMENQDVPNKILEKVKYAYIEEMPHLTY